MLIGIDANEANLTSHRVGINQYAFDLLHALYGLKTPHKFLIYLKNSRLPDLPSEHSDWQYRIIPFPKLWTQTRLPFDLFTHNQRPDVFLSLTHYAPRWSRVPTVVTIMDLGFLKTPEQFTKKDFNQLNSWTSYSVKKAKKIVAISEATKKDIINRYHRPSQDIVVSYPSYDKNMFTPQIKPEILSKYSITAPYLLFLSTLKPSKNVSGLVQAFALLKTNKYSLVIAGKKGWLYEDIYKQVKSLGLENQVTFTGFVDESDVPVLMSMSSAFVMPSFYEGFGIPVLEAMACGTPVVISDIASLPEVGGEAAIYVDPHDPSSIAAGIKTAIGPKRTEFVKKGLNQVKSFDWHKTALQVIATLEKSICD